MSFLQVPDDSPYLDGIPEDINDLFHYTDAGGLIGMVESKKLWLTSIHYLNDSEEYYYSFNLVKKILAEDYPGLIDNVEDFFRDGTSTVFSFSLSEERDLLSQWRGYCPNGGFAVSFDRIQLNEVIKRECLSVVKCIYKESEQRDFIIKYVFGFTPNEYTEARDSGSFSPRIFYFPKHLFENVSAIAPFLKHFSFAEEKEWRIFKKVATSSDSKSLGDSVHHYISPGTVKVRNRKNLLIPYLSISLEKNHEQAVDIKEVVVSPTPHKNLALEACQVLLHGDRSYNYNALVTNSTIPYVNW